MKQTPYLMLPEPLLTALTQFFSQQTLTTTSLTDTLNQPAIAFRWLNNQLIKLDISANIGLADLQGIDTQKQKLLQNTQQFLAGYPANHVLMTGARGTGKSSLVRALLLTFANQGLRMIEIARDDLQCLPHIRQAIAKQPYKYIIYCDDLAFNKEDENYRSLKSLLDGALDSNNDNVLIYATSNRRHLLPQLMKDNIDIYNGQTDEVNPYETIDETVSLSDRFGIWLSFQPMNQNTYLAVCQHYIKKAQLNFDEHCQQQALVWASNRGGRSGRVAYQFSRHWVGSQLWAQTHDNG